MEYAAGALAQCRVAYESGGRRPRDVDEPRLYTTDHSSPPACSRAWQGRDVTRAPEAAQGPALGAYAG